MSKEFRYRPTTLWKLIARLLLVASLPLLPWACKTDHASQSTSTATSHKVPRRFLYPDEFPPGKSYSPGVLVGDTLYIAGQTDLDPRTGDQVGEVEA